MGWIPKCKYQEIKYLLNNSEKLYREMQSQLSEVLRQSNPLIVLSQMPYYDLLFDAAQAAGMQHFVDDWDMPRFQMEMLQALALQIDPDELSREPLRTGVLDQIRDRLEVLCDSHILHRADPSATDPHDRENTVVFVQKLLYGTPEIARNLGYHFQTRRMAHGLYGPFDHRLLEIRGFSVSDIIDVFEKMLTEVRARERDHLGVLTELFKSSGTDRYRLAENYHELLGLEKEEAERFVAHPQMEQCSLGTLRAMIMDHHDQRLPDVYTFSTSELAEMLSLEENRVGAILDQYALAWGALTEYESEHFHLSNPIWEKPLVRLDDDRYFCPLPDTFLSFMIPCMEAVLSPFAAEVADRRTEYLESSVAEIVKRRFPGCDIRRNFRWTEGDRTHEADLIAWIDSFALVIECKSGKVTPSEFRNTPEQLVEMTQELLVEPSQKSLRLKRRLESPDFWPDMADSICDGIGHDLRKVRKVVRVSVCLENFRFVLSSLGLLESADWFPENFEPCPTMSLSDFEMIFDLLEHPVQILHYLSRREEIEKNARHLSDEHDLLGLYLTTLLNIDNVDSGLAMDGLALPLDTYYQSSRVGVTQEKPRPATSPLFASVLSQLEQHGIDRWTEIGVALSMFSPEDQNRVVRILTRLERGVRRNWKRLGHKNTVVCTPSRASGNALGYVMFKNGNADAKWSLIEKAASDALKSNHVRTVVVITKNIDRDDVAYDEIALYDTPVDSMVLTREASSFA